MASLKKKSLKRAAAIVLVFFAPGESAFSTRAVRAIGFDFLMVTF